MRGSSNSHSKTSEGIVIIGIVESRTRRTITDRYGAEYEVVTYTICANGKRYFVEDFSPEEYFEKGVKVEVPVYIKPYIKKNGTASYSIGRLKLDAIPKTHGEEF